MGEHLWEAFQGRCTCGFPCASGAEFKAHADPLPAPTQPSKGDNR